MRLKVILDRFHTVLDARFGKNEVDSFNLLIAHYLSIKRIQLVLEPEYVISKEQEQPLFDALERLALEEPIQYIIGETEFYGMPFKVNQHTLIPRPETEELVDWIIKSHSESYSEHSRIATGESQLKILDLGTGSGCIAISLANANLNAQVYALDVSKEALNIAKQNAELNAVHVEFIKLNILDRKTWDLKFSNLEFDTIVSNPPYVRNLEKADINPNVLNNEPHLALFVDDEDPLQFYSAICEFAQTNLKDKGVLYFEINEYLGKEMMDLMKNFNFKDVVLKQDLFGKDRMIKGTK